MNNYQPITELTEGQEFHGYQQYFMVLSVDESIYAKSGKGVTLFTWAGECHRVEYGDYNDMLERLNASLDPTDNHDDYFEQEHPEITLCAAWPDDCDFDEHPELKYTEIGPVDCLTGEIYNWLP